MEKTTKPLYQSLKAHIIAGIQSGRWSVHAKVSSENELCLEFDVSRMTANRALKELTEEGILYRIQGLGTFVSETKPVSSVLQIKDIAEEVEERGNHFHSEVIAHKEVNAPPQISHHLKLKAHAKVFYSLVLHFENDKPIQLEERFIKKKAVPDYLDIDLECVTANQHLRQSTPLSNAQHLIEAISPDAPTTKLLQIKSKEPCLLITRMTWSNNNPVTYSRLLHPGSRYTLGA